MSNESVHALLHGQPLCGFTKDVPVHWPEGHKWTGVADIGNITCPTCKQEAEKLQEKNTQREAALDTLIDSEPIDIGGPGEPPYEKIPDDQTA